MAKRRKKKSSSHTKSPRKSSRRAAAARKGWAKRRRKGTAHTKRRKPGHRRHWVKGHTTRKGTRVKGHYSHEGKKRKSPKRRRAAPCTPAIAARRSAGRKRRLQRALTRAEREAIKKGNTASRKIERLQKQLAAAEARKRARRHKHRPHHKRKKHHRKSRRHVMRAFNPIHGWGQGLAATGGILIGALVTILSDRVATSHQLTAVGGGSGYADSPAQGQLYNADSPAAPIWSSWKRLAVAGADLVVPFGLSMATKKHPKTQTFFQGWLIAAGATVGGKTLMDLLVKVPMLNRGPKGARLFAPEITSKNALAVAKGGALPAYALTSGGTGPAPGGGTANAPGANAAAHNPAPMLGDPANPAGVNNGIPMPGNVAPNGPLHGPGFGPPAGGSTPNGSLECPPGMANTIPNGALPACASFMNPEDDEESGAPQGAPQTMVS